MLAFGMGWFLLCQTGAPLFHYMVNADTPYWSDPLPVLGHVVGLLALACLIAARKSIVLASHLLVWSSWLATWIAVVGVIGTSHINGLVLYLATGPLLAGLLLRPSYVILAGGLSVFGAAAMGATGLVGPASAINASLLTMAATVVLGISAYVRHVDDVIIDGQSRQLLARTAELEAITDAASDGMIALDPVGRIVDANPAAMAILGDAPLPRGSAFWTAVPTPLADAVHAMLDAAGEPAPVEVGEDPILRVTMRPLGASHAGHLVTLQDVTDAKAAEEQRRIADMQSAEVEKLQELNRFKANLLNSASHELNTPLTPVRLQVELLRSTQRGPLNDRQIHSLDILDRNIKRLSTLIGDILDVARLDGARLPLRCVPVAIDRLVKDELSSFQESAKLNGLELEAQIDGQAWVWGDPGRLAQVTNSLVTNAIKFTKEGRILIHVTASDGWATLAVEDTGVGVPEGREGHLFEPFAHTHSSDVDLDGSGMGLYMSKAIIEAHGGDIGYERHDTGSRFWFRVPVDAMGPDKVPSLLTN